MSNYTCIELFAGVGGLGEGFRRAGFEILLASDIWDVAAKTYKLNHPEVEFITSDIYDLESDHILKTLGIKRGDIDVIVGGPPCQGFSTVGKRNEEDPRNLLFKEYIRMVDELSPKIFVMENVKGIISMNGGDIYKNIIEGFKEVGYKVETKILNSADFGVPQTRERVIFIGTRLDVDVLFPKEEYEDKSNQLDLLDSGLKPYITLEEALSDLPVVEAGEKSDLYISEPQNEYQAKMREGITDNKVKHQESGRHSDKILKMMKYIEEGSSVWESEDIPEELKPKSGYGNTYARLESQAPGMTITRNFSCVSSSRCIHPKYNRGLTPREAARIQSFPDSYNFTGTKTDISIQIGNAVPPILSEKIAIKIRKMLDKSKTED